MTRSDRETAMAELRALLAQAPLDDDTAPGAAAAEVDLLARWLEEPGTRIEHSEQGCAEPVAGGRALSREHDLLARARRRTARPELELDEKRQRRAAG